MDFASFIGILAGFGLIIGAIFTSGSLNAFIDIPSFIIVFGGTIGASLVNYTFTEFIDLLNGINKILFKNKDDYLEKIHLLVNLASKSRKNGILSIERDVEAIDDPFIKKGLQMLLDGAPSKVLEEVIDTELSFTSERHRFGYEILLSMGSYSPAMGLIGTLIGLVQMLQNLNDPKTIGPSMSIALITTFYGAIFANLLFMPLAGKLKRKSQKEILFKQILGIGICSIANGENPKILESRLLALFTQNQRDNWDKK